MSDGPGLPAPSNAGSDVPNVDHVVAVTGSASTTTDNPFDTTTTTTNPFDISSFPDAPSAPFTFSSAPAASAPAASAHPFASPFDNPFDPNAFNPNAFNPNAFNPNPGANPDATLPSLSFDGPNPFQVVSDEMSDEERRARLVDALRARDVFWVGELLRPGTAMATLDWALVPEEEWNEFISWYAESVPFTVDHSGMEKAVALVRAVREKRAKLAMLLIAGGAYNVGSPDVLCSLHWALKTDQVEVVDAILQHASSMQLNSTDEMGRTPLMCAAQFGYAAVAQKICRSMLTMFHDPGNLIRAMSPLDVTGKSCFHLAVQGGHGEVVGVLLDYASRVGIPVLNHWESHVESVLHLASRLGREDAVTQLLSWSKSPSTAVSIVSKDGHTPLSIASASGQSRTVAQLLDAGAPPNPPTPGVAETESLRNRVEQPRARVPLVEALSAGHYDIMVQLLAAGADISAVDPRTGHSALELATMSENEDALAVLELTRGKSLQVVSTLSLVKAIKHGSESDAAAVLAQGADPNLMVSGERPLVAAIKAHKLSAVKQLLIAGADPQSECVVTLAVLHRFAEAIPLLIEHGAEATTASSLDLLCKRAAIGNLEAVELLLKAGTNAVAKEQEQQPLMGAIAYGHHAVAELLLQHIDNPDAVVEDNSTPLMYAVELGDKDSIAMLLAHGADASYELPGTSSSALSVAIERAQLDVLQMLIDAGTDLSRGVGMQQVTPLLLACKRGSTDVMELLLKAGADPAQPDASGDGVWAYATRSSLALPVVEKLHQHGLVFPLRSPHGVTIVSQMIKQGSARVVKALCLASGLVAPVEPPAGEVTESSPLLDTAFTQDSLSTPIIEALVLYGERAAPFDPHTGAALAKAAASCNEDLCAAIITAGASVDYQDPDGYTALMRAANFPAMVGFLLLHQANLFLTNSKGRRAVEMTCDRHSVALLRYVEEKGALLQVLVGARVGAPNDGEFVANSLSRWTSHSSFDINVVGIVASFISGKRPAFLRIRE